ncbi:MAG TPA: LysM peptidoglycan-binding domain-containing protein [Anaerolineaceae bacterium]|nr:LysM peptidoglycan-binding domain-containing protein [Anaerolineaceae bacterium]HPN52357.1 LysM peptidoglycan-binding domain-containing protein [Anaerolineaceae bacterium]
MKTVVQLAGGMLLGLISLLVVVGTLSLSLIESQTIAVVPTDAPAADTATPMPEASPTSVEPSLTPAPGEMTATPQPTLTRTTAPSKTFAPPTECPPPQGWSVYMIQNDDTLTSLAQKYRVTVEQIIHANCLMTSSLLPGTILYLPSLPKSTATVTLTPEKGCPVIPSSWVLYRIQRGDTLNKLSLAVGISVSEIQRVNCMGASTLLVTNQTIYLPRLPQQVTSTRTPIFAPTLTATYSAPVPPTPTAESTSTAGPTSTPEPSSTPEPTLTQPPTPTETQTPVPSEPTAPSPDIP